MDSGKETLQTVDGINVPRKDIFSSVSNLRNITNVPDTVLKNIIDAQNSSSIEPYAYGDENDKDGYISNVITYAKNVYNGTWKAYDYENNWESSANYAIDTDFPGNTNHCGPIAITNAIMMYGKQYNNSLIKGLGQLMVFSFVMNVNKNSGEEYYTPSGGTSFSTVGEFIEKSFHSINKNIEVKASEKYTCNIEGIKKGAKPDRLMFIDLQVYGPPYAGHAVIGFAWNCVRCSGNGDLKYFVKIADGQNKGGRYLDQYELQWDRYCLIQF